jgi:hypothetical protein
VATQTGKTRTITGYMADLLEYPRYVIERDVDFTHCHYGGHFNAFIEECTHCRFGPACRWLDRNRTPSLEHASVQELSDVLEGAIRYLRAGNPHKVHCVCKTCHWLRKARYFRRSHLKTT